MAIIKFEGQICQINAHDILASVFTRNCVDVQQQQHGSKDPNCSGSMPSEYLMCYTVQKQAHSQNHQTSLSRP